jgi:hypothetical protein
VSAPEQILRDRLIAALRSVETAAPRLQVPYGAMADAVLALGDLESRWEVRGGEESDDVDDRWFSFCATREQADAVAAKDDDAELFALFSLKFTPISVERGGT